MIFQKWGRGGVKGSELFQKFIQFGSGILPLGQVVSLVRFHPTWITGAVVWTFLWDCAKTNRWLHICLSINIHRAGRSCGEDNSTQLHYTSQPRYHTIATIPHIGAHWYNKPHNDIAQLAPIVVYYTSQPWYLTLVSTPLGIKHYILLPQIVQSQTTTDISHCFQILQYFVDLFYLCISNTCMRVFLTTFKWISVLCIFVFLHCCSAALSHGSFLPAERLIGIIQLCQ